jgi:hypothetical protein
LVNSQFAEIDLGLVEHLISRAAINIPEAIGLELGFVDLMFISLVEDGM